MAAKRKPCKRGKVRRRVKGGRVMCVAKKKAAPKRKKAVRKSRARRRGLVRSLPSYIAAEVRDADAEKRRIFGPGLYRSYNAARNRGSCGFSLSAERLKQMAKTAEARNLLDKEIAYYSKWCQESID